MTDKPKAKRNYPFRGKIYTSEQIDSIIDGIEIDAYTKTETNTLLAQKQNVLTAGDGISIENDTISAIISSPDWILHNTYDWSSLFEQRGQQNYWYAKYDTVVVFRHPSDARFYYIPKDASVTNVSLDVDTMTSPPSTDEVSLMRFRIPLTSLITTTSDSKSFTRYIVTLNATDNTITINSNPENVTKRITNGIGSGVTLFYKP